MRHFGAWFSDGSAKLWLDLIFEGFSNLKDSVICRDEWQRLISPDPGKMGTHFKDFFGPTQQLAPRAWIFLFSWNNTEKISHLSPSPSKMSNSPSPPDFCPTTRDRMAQQSEQQLRLIYILSGSLTPPATSPSTACFNQCFHLFC